MAYLANDPNDPENKNPQAPVTTSAAPGSGPMAGGKNAASNANPPQPFQNLQAYLGANQNQIQDQANKISGDLTNQYGQTISDIDKAAGDFGSQVKGGSTAVDQGLIDQAANNPTGFASDPNNVANFQKQWNNTYTGPANYETTGGYGNVNKEVENAAANANLVGTNAGLKTYLQNKSSGQYTQGDSTLDAALLRGNPGAITQVQNAAKPFTTLGGYLSKSVTGADQGVQDAINAAQAGAQGVQNRFTGQVIPGFESGVDTGLATAQQQAADRAAAAKNALVNGTLDTQTAQDLGLTQDELNSIISEQREVGAGWSPTIGQGGNPIPGTSVDLAQWLTQQNPGVQINRGAFATPDQYAEAAALAKLTGQDMTGFLDQGNIGKAGTANMNLSQFDKQGLLDYLGPLYAEIEKAKMASNPLPGNPGIPVMPGTPTPHINIPNGTVTSGGGQYTWTDPEGKVHGAF